MILEIRPIRQEEVTDSYRLMATCFQYGFDDTEITDDLVFAKEKTGNPDDKADLHWQNRMIATEDGQLVAQVLYLPYTVWFDGHQVSMSGIGGVSTHPLYRRRGLIRSCFDEILPRLYEDGVLLSHLYPFSERFYAHFGYEMCCHSILWTLDTAFIPPHVSGGSFTLYDGKGDLEDVRAIYQKASSHYNMMLCRDDLDWRKLSRLRPNRDNRFLYIYKNEQGEPTGYFAFEKQRENGLSVMDCFEWMCEDMESVRAMMDLARRLNSDYDLLRFTAPSDMNLDYFCMDFMKSRTSRSLISNGMSRVVRVQDALMLAKYDGSGEAVIEIVDEQLPQNSGGWHIVYRDNRAVSVEKTDRAPDAVMSVGVFSAALLGHLDLAALRLRPDITLHNPNALRHLFPLKHNWINNYF